MSKFAEFETGLKSIRLLAAALQSLGHKPEVHPAGITITDYDGNRHPAPALVVIRKGAGFCSDFGFTRHPDGTLGVVVDDYDQLHRLGPQWMGRLRQSYKEHETLAVAHAKGYVLQSREVVETASGPQVTLQFAIAR